MKKRYFILIYILFSCQFIYTLKPTKTLKKGETIKSPDYRHEKYWAALPWTKDMADEVPLISELKDNQSKSEVDVFFIHPTTYIKGRNWNGDLEDEKLNNRTDNGTIKHQASVFNACCKIYAPRYRQAVIKVFFKESKEGEKSLELAYTDVRNSFEYYMENWNKGKPFILASHSQGTMHAMKLLNEVIAGSKYQKQFIVGYLIGMPFSEKDIKLKTCKNESDTGCIINWNTFLENTRSERLEDEFNSALCVNPLSWKKDEVRIDKKFNKGSLNSKFEKIYSGEVSAKCDKGHLWINKPNIENIISHGRGKNFHVMDYALFYMNIRENSLLRVKSFLENNEKPNLQYLPQNH